MQIYKKYMSLLLATGMLASTIVISFGSSETPSYSSVGEGDDAFMTDELLQEEGGDDWDHETWDDEHKELAWVALATTTWKSTVPPLRFGEKGSAWCDDDVEKWIDDNSTILTPVEGIVNDSKIEDDEKEYYKLFIKALAYTMDHHERTIFHQRFDIANFLIGGKKATEGSDDDNARNCITQIAKRVVDNYSSTNSIYSREGLQKVLNGIVRSSQVNSFTKWLWDQGHFTGADEIRSGMEYEMSGWKGRLDSLGEESHTYNPPSTTTTSSSAST